MKFNLRNIMPALLALTAAFNLTLNAQNAAQSNDWKTLQDLLLQMAGSEVLEEATVGICVRSKGRTLIDVNAGKMMNPASNVKVITTGAALHALGNEYRFSTGIGYDGNINDGILDGNLYIIGDGDPTLGSKDSIATSLEVTFAQWEKLIRDAGIKEINGQLIGASRDFFNGMAEEPTWQWNDIGTYYGAGVTGLMFYENMQSFEVSAGAEIGKPVHITPSYPETPWMKFRYDCTTGKEGTGDQLYMFTSGLEPSAEIRGTFGVDRKPKRVDCSNKFPELTCAHYFFKWLEGSGMKITGGYSDDRLFKKTWNTDSLKTLGNTESPQLHRIVYETNHISNNLYAETMLRTLGKEFKGNGCYDSSYVAIRNILKDLGVDTSRGYTLQDGSGLSRQNFISADFLCRFLEAMMESPVYETYVKSLPSPGGPGTLGYNMKNHPSELKARIHAKSGSMNGVRCYSGYILPGDGNKDNTIIFSIMVNNCTAPSWKVRPLMDKMMGMLALQN